MAAQRLRPKEEDDPGPHRGIPSKKPFKKKPFKKEAKEIQEMRKFRNPKLASKKVVLKFTRSVLRCTSS
jgi:hypothetical protein